MSFSDLNVILPIRPFDALCTSLDRDRDAPGLARDQHGRAGFTLQNRRGYMRYFLTKGAAQASILVGSILGTVVAGTAGGFIETDLVANKSPLTDANGTSHTPAHVDSNLLNAWGL